MKKSIVIVGITVVLFSLGIVVSAQLFDNYRERGDVNGDGVINVLDALRTVNIILDIQPPPTQEEIVASDCNGDGQTNVIDVLGIVNVILEISTCVSSCDELDCDDGNPCTEDYCDTLLIQCIHDTVSTGTAEMCEDGIDNDCDGLTDCQDSDCLIDEDGDGYYAPPCGNDCNDQDGLVNPGTEEECNGKDDNCDQIIDDEGSIGCTVYYRDYDRDGYGKSDDSKCLCAPDYYYDTEQAGDCRDTDASVHPGVTEICNGQDDDCDGESDEEGATGCTVYYRDNDDDGYGQSGDSKCLCSGVSPYDATQGEDCNDNDASMNPGEIEICDDSKDNDCDDDTDCIDGDCFPDPVCDGSGCGIVTDIDGNEYQTVIIGGRCWLAENLKVTHYRNGDAIPNVTDDTDWSNLQTGAYCNYDNNTGNAATYGRLYNWYAVDDGRGIAPLGWHVPTDTEWKQLEMSLGMSQAEADAIAWRGTDEGGKMKTTGTVEGGNGLWYSPNSAATNESGFSALPAGHRGIYDWDFYNLGYITYLWCSTQFDAKHSWYRALDFANSKVSRTDYAKADGFSVRCVRDD